MRASYILAFSRSKTAISFNILLVLQILCRYKRHACRLACTDRFPNVPTKLFFFFLGGGGGGATGYASAVHTIALALIFWWMYHNAYFTVGSCIIFQIETDVVVHLPCLHFLGELLRSTVHIIRE